MKQSLSEAVRVYTRYDLPDENDDTRRKRNARVGLASPEFIIPEEGLYLWDWFQDISSSVSRVCDGYYRLISPSDFLAWSTLTGNLINPMEYAILKAMDVAFCAETNKEIKAKQDKELEKGKKQWSKPLRN